MTETEDFAAWLGRQLRRREWTAADLARNSGLSTSRISDWLLGKRRPNPASCIRLADALNVDLDDVLALAGHRLPTGPTRDDPVSRLCNMLKRVQLTPDRQAGLEATIHAWMELDRSAPSSAAHSL